MEHLLKITSSKEKATNVSLGMDSNSKEEFFFNEITNYCPDYMAEEWIKNQDDFFDSIFAMNTTDDIMNFDDKKALFESLDDLSDQIKREVEEYEMVHALSSNKSTSESDHKDEESPADDKLLSSNSSDSGLSSDNLDVEMSPEYEPLSPTISSPGPSISERGRALPSHKYQHPVGAKNLPAGYFDPQVTKTAQPNVPKVIIQKMPQTFATTVQKEQPTKSAARPTINLMNGKEMKIVKLTPQLLANSTANNRKVMIQVKNSPQPMESTSGTVVLGKTNGGPAQKLIRVKNAAVNPRSVLLPVSIQDVRGLGAIKFINAAQVKNKQQNILNKVKQENVAVAQKVKPIPSKSSSGLKRHYHFDEPASSAIDSDVESIIYEEVYSEAGSEIDDTFKYERESSAEETEVSYPKLNLTLEEKRLLAKEGISLPSHYPLTKHEERELKRIRRKIRNKISAQDSRKRKKEYVDGLEERVKQCTEENQTLLKRIKLLQNQNQSLMSQMKKLQALLSKGTNKTAQPATCLMVLLMSLALIAAPNLKLGKNAANENELAEVVQETILQNRRNLLFDVKNQIGDIIDDEILFDDISLDELMQQNDKHQASSCKKPKLIDFDVDDDNWYNTKEIEEMRGKEEENFNTLAMELQRNVMEYVQTSGFNISGVAEAKKSVYDADNFLDRDVMEMVSQKSDGVFELNFDKLNGFETGGEHIPYQIPANQISADRITTENVKFNTSELRNARKY